MSPQKQYSNHEVLPMLHANMYIDIELKHAISCRQCLIKPIQPCSYNAFACHSLSCNSASIYPANNEPCMKKRKKKMNSPKFKDDHSDLNSDIWLHKKAAWPQCLQPKSQLRDKCTVYIAFSALLSHRLVCVHMSSHIHIRDTQLPTTMARDLRTL